ncbi:hypothetical protein [Xylella fastidiosa]|uniref:hypothetical protein n=1 Tax=Xylella fastidiosa TaxID=2371 RepID=UPI00003801BC|nr:hypothetical protein [Xylella fastidiosa]KAJ4852195.1 hypothetical protein XYFPCFBP8418_009980 [Xylella fastidiosa subsp. multiplex]MDC6411600.1 hypothetical protein [Xylella fastidiosa subsp. multiplex]MDC6414959.1 hypothetical protein [Xylella fastidiosa subsp. multiplex]MDC6418192.1 hypothetical protein [Xylella fastidiosa subsp. multiplex]MDD0886244.1 hypothetical protein [Xylella fastidiosa subsp. multiplex]
MLGDFNTRVRRVKRIPAVLTQWAGFVPAVATQVTQTAPPVLADGDVLLAFVMHRSGLTVIPSGFTLVAVASGPTGYAGRDYDQYLSIYQKRASKSDAGCVDTWGQRDNERLIVGYHRYTGPYPLRITGALPSWTHEGSHQVQVPSLGALTAMSDVVLAAATLNITTSSTVTAQVSAGWEIQSLATTGNLRLLVAAAVPVSPDTAPPVLDLWPGEWMSGNFNASIALGVASR